MKTFPLVISSPDGDLFNGNAVSISVRGVEGELAVLAGHIPFVTAVKPCKVVVELEETTKEGYTDGGILTVSADKTTLLSGVFEWK